MGSTAAVSKTAAEVFQLGNILPLGNAARTAAQSSGGREATSSSSLLPHPFPVFLPLSTSLSPLPSCLSCLSPLLPAVSSPLPLRGVGADLVLEVLVLRLELRDVGGLGARELPAAPPRGKASVLAKRGGENTSERTQTLSVSPHLSTTPVAPRPTPTSACSRPRSSDSSAFVTCAVRDADMGQQLAGGQGSWCPELESRTTRTCPPRGL